MENVKRLEQDIINSMKSHNKERLEVLRMVKATMKQEKIDRNREINDELLIDIVNKQIKMRQDSLADFEKGNRRDLIEKTSKEIEILKEYLPEQLTEEEARQIINDVMKEIKPEGPKDMGKVMREITPKLKGKYDMGKASEIIKEELNRE